MPKDLVDVVDLDLPDPPEVGVHFDVPFATYANWPCINNSGLKVIYDQSPAHFLAGLEEPYEPSPSQILGNRIHHAVLEPGVFDSRYDIAGGCSATTNKGKPCSYGGKIRAGGKWFCGTHGRSKVADDVEVISEDDYETCMRIREAVFDHPMAGAIVEDAAAVEMSCVWRESTTGLLCKGRLDIDSPEFDCIADLKSTRDASAEEFSRSIANYAYHRGSSFYLNGAASLGRHRSNFNFIAVEKERPYSVVVYRIERQAIDQGAAEIADALHKYKKCIDDGRFPGYGTGIQDVDLPYWAYRN